jgi:Na+/H+ antiporter NhaC
MDQKVADAFSRSYSASMRSVKFNVFLAALLAIYAGYSLLNNQMWSGVLQGLSSIILLFSALKLRQAVKKLRPFFDPTAER